jgi:tripartite ATP-independent transporter DctP family solute receptor
MVFVLSIVGCSNSADKSTDNAAAGTEEKAEKVVIKLAHVLQPGNESLWQRNAEQFKKLVEEKSAGQMEVQIFPSGQLGGERQVIEQMQTGALEAAITTSGPLGNFDPVFNLYCLPYLFADIEETRTILNGPIGDEFKTAMKDNLNIIHIGWIEDGFRNVFTKEPLKDVSDMKGLKLRTMEAPVWIETYKAFGAGAVPMAYTELYSALQQGVVDGADALTTNYLSDKMYEVAPCYNLLEFAKNPTSLLLSQKFYDGLTPEQQKILDEAGKETQQYGYDQYDSYMAGEFQQVCDELNAQVVEVDKTSFMEATKPAWDLITKDVEGSDAWLERVQAEIDAYRASK